MSVAQTAVLQTNTVYILSTVFKSGCDIPVLFKHFRNILEIFLFPVNKPTTRQTSHSNDFVNAKSHAREKPLLCLEKSQKSQFILRNGRNRMPKKPKNHVFRIFENSIRPSFRTNIYLNQYPLSAPSTVLQSLSFNVKRVDCLYLPSGKLPPKSPTTHISSPPRQLQTHQKQNILPIISLLQMY